MREAAVRTRKLLIVNPDPDSRARVAALAAGIGWQTSELESAGDAPGLLEAAVFDAVLLARDSGPGELSVLREIRRRSRVVGAFPDGQSALNLAAARLRYIAGSEWSTKRYLNMELLKDQQMSAITA